MERYSVAIVFDHRNRTKDGQEGPLEVRLTIARKAYYINSNVRVKRDQWAGSVVNRPDMDALNERLGMVVQDVSHMVNGFMRDGVPVDVDKIRERLFDAKKRERDGVFIDWCRDQIPNLNMTSGTRKRYEMLVRRLDDYGKINKWEDLTVDSIYAFDGWLHNFRTRKKCNKRRVSDAAVYNYHKCLRALLSRAVKLGKIEDNVYDKLKGEFSRGEKENVEYLTEDEMRAVMSIHPLPGSPMAISRDLFIFQMFTGLSYSDAQNFDIKDYKKVDGKYVSVGNRMKTGVAYVSQLLPPAVDVLERYGMEVPKIGNADYNHSLKAIQLATGITTRMHSHLARHTFATYMLRHGVKIENLAKMMGHSTIRETQKYAKVLATSVHAEFDKIAEMIKKKTAEEKADADEQE